MSTPESKPSLSSNGDRRPSLGGYLKRVSSVFKKKKGKDTAAATVASSASNIEPAKEEVAKDVAKEDAAKEEVAKEEATIEEVAPTTPATAPAPAPSLAPPPPKTTVIATQPYNRITMQQERARALFAKYGLILETHEALSPPLAAPLIQRVEKPIRMRVHRSCHHCGTQYGSSKVCQKCEHKRCKKCPRYPDKNKNASSAVDNSKGQGADIAGKPRCRNQLTITKKGRDVAYQPTQQRVRRTCHKCEALFIPPTATTCAQCDHVRCTRCPREPAKRAKWPTGYPGDVEAESESEVEKQVDRFRRTWRKPRMRVRWECEECRTLFVHGQVACAACGHERCGSCTRFPPKKAKTEPQFDAQVVAAVEAKLRALAVESDSAA